MKDKYLKEDFYFCDNGWLINDNPTRIFRLGNVYNELAYDGKNGDVDGVEFFYPMYDGVYVTEKHLDSNGNVTESTKMEHMRKADYSLIRRYIGKVYDNTRGFKMYDNTDELIMLWIKMEHEFKVNVLFTGLIKELKGFQSKKIYTDKEKVLLNLLRSYYKTRILNK